MHHETRNEIPALWTVVLAAGQGTRFARLARALHGEDLPKQYVAVQGRRSMLQTTLLRTAPLSPSERTVVVVAKEWEELAHDQVHKLGPVDLVAQPANLGTGPGILLPLAHVLSRDPDAIVAILPSDHYVRDEQAFVASVRHAEAVALREDGIVLVAAVAEKPETQYGWIRTGEEGHPGSYAVSGFIEKPTSDLASELFEAGALWNTFIMVGPARCFWDLGRRFLPEQTALFEASGALHGNVEYETLERIYERMPAADFSKDVLEKSESLSVVPLGDCGWSDWGTPERVLQSLHGTMDFDSLAERLAKVSARVADFAPQAAREIGQEMRL